MTKTHTTPATAADPTVAAASAQFLTPVVLGPAGPRRQRQAGPLERARRELHRDPRAPRLRSSRTRRTGADEAAERIVALGLPIDARVGDVAGEDQATAVPAGFTQWEAMVRDVIADIDAVIADTAGRDRRPRRVRPHQPGRRDRHQGRAREGPLVPLRAPRRVARYDASPRPMVRGIRASRRVPRSESGAQPPTCVRRPPIIVVGDRMPRSSPSEAASGSRRRGRGPRDPPGSMTARRYSPDPPCVDAASAARGIQRLLGMPRVAAVARAEDRRGHRRPGIERRDGRVRAEQQRRPGVGERTQRIRQRGLIRPDRVGQVAVVERVLGLHARGDAQPREARDVGVRDELRVLDASPRPGARERVERMGVRDVADRVDRARGPPPVAARHELDEVGGVTVSTPWLSGSPG